jgi:pimeloyl-ACP methyl ester carboxylesterase
MSIDWREGYVEASGGARLFYQEAGLGPPIVFLHGYSLDLTNWLRVAERLVEHNRVILYDMRGQGRSTGAGEAVLFTTLADDVYTVLEQLKVSNPLLCGHSMGGNTLLQFAVGHPEIAARQVLVSPPGVHNLWVNPLSHLSLVVGSSIASLVGIEPPQKPFVPLDRWLFWSPGFRKSHPEVVEDWERQFLAVPIQQLVCSMRCTSFRPNLRHELGKIRFPTLILRGSEDRLVFQAEVELYQKNIPGARIEILDGAGHMSPDEQPEKVAQWIASFLETASLDEAKAG